MGSAGWGGEGKNGLLEPAELPAGTVLHIHKSFKREWVAAGGSTAHAQGTRAGQRDNSLESQRKVPGAAGMACGRVPPWQGGPREV